MKEKAKEKKKDEKEDRALEKKKLARKEEKQLKKESKQLRRKGTYTIWNSIGTGLHEKFAKVLKSGPLGRYLTSYGSFEKAVRDSFAATMPRDTLAARRKKKFHPKREIGTENIDGSLAIYNPATLRKPISSRFRKAVSGNRLIPMIVRLLSDIPRAPVSALGTFVFSLGIASVLAQILKFLFGGEISGVVGTLICGFLLLLLSVPVISRNNVSLGHYVLTSRFGYKILAPMMGITDDDWDFEQDHVRQPGWFNIFAALIGLSGGGLTYLFPLSVVVVTVLLIVLCILTAFTPELGLNVILIFLPFAHLYTGGSLILGAFTVYAVLCFLLNILSGKRVMRFEAFDFVILTLSVFMICSELTVPGGYSGWKPIIMILLCTLLYFLTKNLFRAEKWITACMGGLIAASFLVSILGIAQGIRQILTDGSFAVTSVFDAPEQLAVYLLLTLFLTVGSFRQKHLRGPALVITLTAQLACLVLTGSKTAMAAFLLTFLLYLGISGKRMFSTILFVVLCLPMTIPFLPAAAVNKIGDFLLWHDPRLVWRMEVWKNSLKLAEQGFFGGIGMSGENFAARYAPVAAGSPAPGATSAWSLYLDLLIGTGILGLLLFLAVALLFIRQAFTFYNQYVGTSQNVCHHQSLFCAVAAILICGFLLDPWSSSSNLCLFWALIGLAVAVKDTVIQERTYYQRELSPTEGDIIVGTGGQRLS